VKLLFSDNEREQSLLEYFENTYIYGKPAMRLRGRIKPQRHHPLFPIDMWSVASRIDANLPRTTNIAESWHGRLNRYRNNISITIT